MAMDKCGEYRCTRDRADHRAYVWTCGARENNRYTRFFSCTWSVNGILWFPRAVYARAVCRYCIAEFSGNGDEEREYTPSRNSTRFFCVCCSVVFTLCRIRIVCTSVIRDIYKRMYSGFRLRLRWALLAGNWGNPPGHRLCDWKPNGLKRFIPSTWNASILQRERTKQNKKRGFRKFLERLTCKMRTLAMRAKMFWGMRIERETIWCSTERHYWKFQYRSE